MRPVRGFDASTAECVVFTYKDGLLAAVAHDLKIRVTNFQVDIDERRRVIAARFDASSLRVVCAVSAGAELPETLRANDRQEIDQKIARDVLDTQTYPDIAFTSSSISGSGNRYVVTGALALHGRQRPLAVRVRRQGTWWVGEADVHQPDFGIEPYRAMLGTLRVKPAVRIRISLPAARAGDAL